MWEMRDCVQGFASSKCAYVYVEDGVLVHVDARVGVC
jgi:hypothetical protein